MGKATLEVLNAFASIKIEPLPTVTVSDMLYSFFGPHSCEKFLRQAKCPVFNEKYPEEMKLNLRELELLEKSIRVSVLDCADDPMEI